MILVCNDNVGVTELLNEFEWPIQRPNMPANLLRANTDKVAKALENEQRWLVAKAIADKLR